MARKKKEPVETPVEAAEPATEEKQLSAQEQLEAMRLYVQSMQKTDGHSNEEVRGIVTSIHKRFLVVLNYSGLSDSLVKPLKVELQKIVDEEQARYKDDP
jgi:vesicle coat complex subunit